MPPTHVLGLDSSTQSTKALLVDAETGEVEESRTSAHPAGTAVDPRAWLEACDEATSGLLERADAVSVAGQQHGMVALDEAGEPVFDALLWNDTRSAAQATDLIKEMGGGAACAETLGSVLVASFTATKLRWLRDNHPDVAARVAQVLLPHDYISWHLAGRAIEPFTDRGDASGTGYFQTPVGEWRPDLLEQALGRAARLPRLVEPGTIAAESGRGLVIAGGTGDNMAAALGLDLRPGDVAVSIGTSGVASAISTTPIADPTGGVTCFADARTGFLPLVTTINAARILDLQGQFLGVDHDELATLALASTAGANGVTILPYYGGERTPNRPDARAVWSGLTDRTTRSDLARAAIEALLCSLADAVDVLRDALGTTGGRILLTGGAARNVAVRRLAPTILGQPIHIPTNAQYVALGAARQAAWALASSAEPPVWSSYDIAVVEGDVTPHVREKYGELRESS
jgi:xylulokinase